MTIQDQAPPPQADPVGVQGSSYVPYPTSSSSPYYVPYAPVSQTTAVWALVLAVVPIPLGWLVSIGLAISVLSQSRDGRGRERGKGMAVAALVIAPLWILAAIALVVSSDTTTHRDTSGHLTVAGDASVDSLRVGDCLAHLPDEDGPTRTVALVPCSAKHEGEVYAEFDLADGAYPGAAEVRRLATGGCVRRFDDQFGNSAAAKNQGLYYFVPLEARWSGDRGVTCLAVTAGVQGSGDAEAGSGV